jgi:hypothetical protein
MEYINREPQTVDIRRADAAGEAVDPIMPDFEEAASV